jgi:S1-C subfamily serine protease
MIDPFASVTEVAPDGDFDDLDLGDEPEKAEQGNPFDGAEGESEGPPPVGADDNWWGADKGVSRAEEAAVTAATQRTAPIDASVFGAQPQPTAPQINASSNPALSRGSSGDSAMGDLLMDPSTAGQMRRGSNSQDHSEVVSTAKALATKLGKLNTGDSDEEGSDEERNFNKYDVDPDDELVGQTFTTTLERADEGFGIVLDHSKNDMNTQLVWVDDVVPDTPAFFSKIKQGDMLLEVNGVEIKTASINTIVKSLTHELVKLVVYRPPAQDQLSSTCTGKMQLQ